MPRQAKKGTMTTREPAATTSAPPTAPVVPRPRAKIRMYRQGLGDCHLIRLPLKDDPSRFFSILIDCGVVLGTPDAAQKMADVVADVAETTGGRIDLLIATHEHWDHLSGFVQAEGAVRRLSVGEVWLAWTEDPNDPLARKLRAEKGEARAGLRLAATRLGTSEADGSLLEGVLEFFGAARGATTADALRVVQDLGAPVRYCRPTDDPVIPSGIDVRLFILGPPPDEALLKRTLPSRSNPEGYGLAVERFADGARRALDGSEPAPFDPIYSIPSGVGRQMDFFRTRYWEAGQTGDGWRRIEAAWLDGAEELALQLDNMTNNTSVVLAIELTGGDVLLFVADAQVGNWLSWQDLTWSKDGTRITGPDLLGRTVFYKVGHHGSHNATLKDKGLEMMPRLRMAMVPVDHEMACKKRWGSMPLPEIIAALEAKVPGHVFRSDDPAGTPTPPEVDATPLYFEAVL